MRTWNISRDLQPAPFSIAANGSICGEKHFLHARFPFDHSCRNRGLLLSFFARLGVSQLIVPGQYLGQLSLDQIAEQFLDFGATSSDPPFRKIHLGVVVEEVEEELASIQARQVFWRDCLRWSSDIVLISMLFSLLFYRAVCRSGALARVDRGQFAKLAVT